MEQFTHSSQFDKSKIKALLHLESLGNFQLLPSEVEYLKKYRQLLKKEVEDRRVKEAEYIKNSVQRAAEILRTTQPTVAKVAQVEENKQPEAPKKKSRKK